MIRLRHFVVVSAALLVLTGCSMTPDYQRPEVSAPAWKGGVPSQSAEIAADWWREFGSDELDALMVQALAQNNDLQASLQRIEQARAGLKIAGASRFPSASATASYMNGPRQAFNITDRRRHGVPEFTGDAGISYELDLFGANRAEVEAAEAGLLGTQYAHDALALIIMGDVAQTYFNVLNLKERRRIAQENLQSTEDLLKAVKARFQAGVRTALDIAQQETMLSNAQAEVAALEQQLALAQNALAVLVGEPPQSFSISGNALDHVSIPAMAAVQPSDLLERRPDIQSMEAKLMAASADIGAAHAAFFPSVNIGTNLLLAANPSASALSLASSTVAPIFQGGRLEGNVNRATARQKELAENYQQTVLVAFQEAEDALTKVKTTQKREDALRQAEAKARESYDLAKQQYSLSVVDFQRVLESQRLMLESKDRTARAHFETLSARIDLFKAMGGGWNRE